MIILSENDIDRDQYEAYGGSQLFMRAFELALKDIGERPRIRSPSSFISTTKTKHLVKGSTLYLVTLA